MIEVIEKLRSWREDCVRDPEAIRDLWPRLEEIEKHIGYEEKWTVIEQFCLAAIDLYDEDMINVFLTRLKKQFKGSNRVKLLDIQANYERIGDYETATRKYSDMLKEDETNTGARKRKIAILVAQHNYASAIKELCDYVRRFMNDQEAWKELCELYLLEQEYPKAIFCMEELLLSNSSNHIYHTRLAEMHYTSANQESLDLARSYYCQALKLDPNNMRALMGLQLTLSHMMKGNRLTPSKRKDYEKLLTWTKTTIKSLYDKEGHPDASKYVKKSIA